jgi:hypothetical protein
MTKLNEQDFYGKYILPAFGVDVTDIEWQHNHRLVKENPYSFYEEDVFRNAAGDWALFHTFEYQQPEIVAQILRDITYPIERFVKPVDKQDSSHPFSYYFNAKVTYVDYPSAYYYLLHVTTREEWDAHIVKENAVIAEWEQQDKDFEEKYKDLL